MHVRLALPFFPVSRVCWHRWRTFALPIMSISAVALGTGCSGANPSLGQSAFMQVQGAQFIAGGIDTEPQATSPEIHLVSLQNSTLFPGVAGKSISGTAGPGSTAILMGLQGDSGHWVFPVQDPDQNTPGDFTFACSASFNQDTPAGDGGALALVFRATDRAGNVGPAKIQPMILQEETVPGGALVVSLDWDTESDLDLHVQFPSGDGGTSEIWSRKPTGLPLGGSGTANATAAIDSGYLDFDSNCECAIDGRRQENVIFPTTAPSGQFIARVDTFSLCSQVGAGWRVRLFSAGSTSPVAVSYGQSTPTDTRFPHGQGAGVQALVFEYNP